MAADIPYPSIVFVPLDILTAEELNQLHANTTALANLFPLAATSIADGAITSSKIANRGVSSDNVDWSTMGNQSTYLKLGNIKICFGATSLSVGNSAYAEVVGSITFPTTFSQPPKVSLTLHDIAEACGEYVSIGNTTTSGFTFYAGHVKATANSSTFSVDYIAIGV